MGFAGGIDQRQRVAQALDTDLLDRQPAVVGTGLDVGHEKAFGCVHGVLLGGVGNGVGGGFQGFSARRRSIWAIRLRLSGAVMVLKLSTLVPLRSIRYLWKFHFGAVPLLAISCL